MTSLRIVGAGVLGLAAGGAIGYGSTKLIHPDFEQQRAGDVAKRDSARAKLADPDAKWTPKELDTLRHDADSSPRSNPLGKLGWIAGATGVVVGNAVMLPRWSVDLSAKSYTTPSSGGARMLGVGLALAGAALIVGSHIAAAERRAD